MKDSRQRSGTSASIPPWAERLVRFLDDGMVVPGTDFRIGFDALLGLVPGIGDLVTTTTGLSLVYLAWQRGVSRPVLARMLMNLGVDSIVGAIPVLGDLFDLVFKANRRNLTLLQRYDAAPSAARAKDTMFLVMAGAAVLLLLTIPIFLAILLVRLILG